MEKKNKEKFEFNPFDKVLARDYKDKWATNFFSHYEGGKALTLGGCEWTEVIPFEGNEHLRGTTDPYVEPNNEPNNETEYEPKDGDFVTFVAYVSKIKFTAICQNYNSCSMLYYVGTIGRERNEIHFNNAYSLDSRDVVKPATGDEKNELLSKLRNIGKDWNEEKKEIVEWKWEPRYDECYYAPFCSRTEFTPIQEVWGGDDDDEYFYKKGWAFHTEEECQLLCDKLNAAIKDVK